MNTAQQPQHDSARRAFCNCILRRMQARRIQLSRRRGWRMPRDAVKVDRATRWGNPFRAGEQDAAHCVAMFRDWLVRGLPQRPDLDAKRARILTDLHQLLSRGRAARSGKPGGRLMPACTSEMNWRRRCFLHDLGEPHVCGKWYLFPLGSGLAATLTLRQMEYARDERYPA